MKNIGFVALYMLTALFAYSYGVNSTRDAEISRADKIVDQRTLMIETQAKIYENGFREAYQKSVQNLAEQYNKQLRAQQRLSQALISELANQTNRQYYDSNTGIMSPRAY